jgi:tetratricopeptide (TPR) repeat protein
MDPKDQSKAELARAKIQRYWTQLERQNNFQIFGADKDTDPEKIKASYKSLAKQWHADAYAGLDIGDAKDMLDAIFKRITEAYETISDPKLRVEYMVLLDRQSRGMSTDVNAILSAERMFDDALLKIRRRDFVGAKKLLEDSIELNPDDPLMPVHLAWVIYSMAASKDRKDAATDAIERLKKVAKGHENSPLAYQYLGQIFFATDRPNEAKKYWRMCLEWEPGNVEAQRGIRLATQRGEAAAAKSGGIAGTLKRLFKKS